MGSVALDTVETPFGKAENVVGGSASFFSAAASILADRTPKVVHKDNRILSL